MENVFCVPIVEWESAYAFGANSVIQDLIMVMPENGSLRRIILN